MPRNRTQRPAAAVASSRVKEDENDGDSEWEQSSQANDDGESSFEHDDAQDTTSQASEEEEKKMPAAKTKKTPSTKATTNSKKRKASGDDKNEDTDEEEDGIPTYARKTAKGGYAHTNKSRARISKANKGNTPWNKGKNRSASVKAKIAAGVRARNRANLLVKLKKLNMTEQEWEQKKKEIKHLRERVRKAKKAAEARDATRKKGKGSDKTYEELQKELTQKLEEQMKAMNPANVKEEDDEEGEEEEQVVPAPTKRQKKEDKKIAAQKKQELLKKVFKPHVNWSRHDYDTHDGLYERICPTGGPGGLACCEVCSSAYSRYLLATAHDVEIQSIHNAGKEVEECIGFMKETRDKLQYKVQVARQQAPPLKHDVEV